MCFVEDCKKKNQEQSWKLNKLSREDGIQTEDGAENMDLNVGFNEESSYPLMIQFIFPS